MFRRSVARNQFWSFVDEELEGLSDEIFLLLVFLIRKCLMLRIVIELWVNEKEQREEQTQSVQDKISECDSILLDLLTKNTIDEWATVCVDEGGQVIVDGTRGSDIKSQSIRQKIVERKNYI